MNTPVLPMDGPCHVGWWNISVNGGGEDSWCKSMAHEFHIHTMNNVNSWPRSFFRNWGHRGGSNCKRSNISYKPALQLYVRCIIFATRRNINIPSFGHAILHRNVHVIWHWVINIVVAGTPPICDRPMQPLTSFDRLHVCQCSQKPLIFFNAHFHHFQSNVIHFRFG